MCLGVVSKLPTLAAARGVTPYGRLTIGISAVVVTLKPFGWIVLWGASVGYWALAVPPLTLCATPCTALATSIITAVANRSLALVAQS